MKTFKNFVNEQLEPVENENNVKLEGILKLSLPQEIISQLKKYQEQIIKENPTMVALPENKLHITLIHQGILKPFKSELKDFLVPSFYSNINLETEIHSGVEDDKNSYWIYADKTTQELLKKYVKDFMVSIGADNVDPEPDRLFHVSLCNKTGSPMDSIAYVWKY